MTIQQMFLGLGAADGPKYVDDYMSTVYYVGDGQPNRVIETGIDLSSDGGAVFIRAANDNRLGVGGAMAWGPGRGFGLTDSISGASGAWWAMNGTYYSATGSNGGLVSNFGNGTVTVADFTASFSGADFNKRQVSNANMTYVNYDSSGYKAAKGYKPMQYIMYVHRQLEGYFKIVQYTGNGGSRSISHDLGAAPGICIALSAGGGTASWWSYAPSSGVQGGSSNFQGTDGYKGNYPVFSSDPNSSTLYINQQYNSNNQVYTLYLWARAESNSKIFGDGENECFAYSNATKSSGWTYDTRPRFDNIFGPAGGTPGMIINYWNRPSYSANNIPFVSDYTAFGTPQGYSEDLRCNKYSSGGLGAYFKGDSGGGYVAFKSNRRHMHTWLGGTDGGSNTLDPAGHGMYIANNPSDGASRKTCAMVWRYADMKPPEHGSDLFNASWLSNSSYTDRTKPFCQGNSRVDWMVCSAEGGWEDKHLVCRSQAWTQTPGHNKLTFTTNGFVKSSQNNYDQERMSPWLRGHVGAGSQAPGFSTGYGLRFTYGFKDRNKAFHHWALWRENSGTHAHNFNAVPKMMLIKKVIDNNQQSASSYNSAWWVYHAGLNGGSSPQNYAIRLDSDAAKQSGSSFWGNTAPTATQYTVGNNNDWSGVSTNSLFCEDDESKMLVSMWGDVDGIQKIGSYTGNGSFVNVDCGFTDGVRFLLIKREDGTGDWYVFDHAHGLGGGQYIDEAVFRTTGTHSWTCPSGVSSVCAVCVGGGGGGYYVHSVADRSGGGGGGLGWKNNISVTAGQSYTVVVGTYGNNNNIGGDSYFINTSTVKGGGGGSATDGGDGGSYTGDGGGNGGHGAAASSTHSGNKGGGGGGAGGYSGNGGIGLNNSTATWPYYANAKGNGGGGSGSLLSHSEGGGGVGLYGEGESGEIGYQTGTGDSTNGVKAPGGAGSAPPGWRHGFEGVQPSNGPRQYLYGGGVVGDQSSAGQRNYGWNGGVRLVWSTNASETVAFPSTNVGCARPPYNKWNVKMANTTYDEKHVCSLPTGFGVHDSNVLNINNAKYIFLAVSGADNTWKNRSPSNATG